MDVSRVYVSALALGCFYSHINTGTFRRALTASVDSCAEIKSAPSVASVTKSGRVWRKVPENDARSVGGPAAWATACLPYHPCPGLRPGETFEGRARPWPLVTDGCHRKP